MKVVAVQTDVITYELSNEEGERVKEVARDCGITLEKAVNYLVYNGEITPDRCISERSTEEVIAQVIE